MTSIEPSSSPAMDADQSGVGALPAPDWLQKCRWTLGLTLTCVALLWAGDVPSRLGYAWYQEQFLVVALGLGLALAFLSRSWTSGHLANGKWSRAADITLAVLGLGAGAWVAASYDTLVSGALTGAPSALIVAGILFALVMEALRRVVGLTLVVVVLSICGYGLVGHLVEGSLQTREVAPADLFVYLGFDPNGLLGLTLSIAATVVVAFVFFGQLLLKSGGAEFFNDAALAAMGRRRGGAAKISIVASSLFGSISGVVVSNIVATGVVTIRLMINAGFKRSTAAAIEAVSSTGGQIVPPVMGAVAFLMADILQKPYAEIVFAAIIPAALYYVALYAQADLRAGRDDIKPLEGVEIPQLQSVFRKGWQFLLPFAVIVLALFVLNQRPEAAGLWGAIAVIIVGLIWGYNGRRAGVKDILDAASETGRQIVDILMIAGAAGLIIGVLSLTGLGFG
ncbi:MAG: TRAP transporter fused permease subunit, partial [Pseudomonadota bacterium]